MLTYNDIYLRWALLEDFLPFIGTLPPAVQTDLLLLRANYARGVREYEADRATIMEGASIDEMAKTDALERLGASETPTSADRKLPRATVEAIVAALNGTPVISSHIFGGTEIDTARWLAHFAENLADLTEN